MSMRTLAQRRPVPMAVTVAFLAAIAVTGAYFLGIVPGIPKTLPTFVSLLEVSAGLFALAIVAWGVSMAFGDGS